MLQESQTYTGSSNGAGSAVQAKTAAVYCRVSTPGQEEKGTSLDTQEEHCRQYAEAKGYRIDEAHVYHEVKTGTELWERPELSRLREAIRNRSIDVVIAYAIDRLSRDPVHLGVILSEADHHNVDVQFVTEPLDNSPEGQLIRFVRGYAAKVEAEKIRERNIRGKRARIKSGKIHNAGGEMYGYRRMKEEGKRAIYEPEAAIVRQIFDWYTDGKLGVRTIEKRLNRDGVPSPAMGKRTYPDPHRIPRWAGGQVRRMLMEPAYKGVTICWRSQKDGSTKPEDQWIYLPDDVTPAIVSLGQWEQAQKRLATNKGQDCRNRTRPYLLRGYVICGLCGRPMHANTERNRRTYRCSSRERASGPCGGSRIPASDVESWVWEEIEKVLRNPSIIAGEVERRRAEGPDPHLTADQASIERHLAKLNKQQAKLLRVFREADDDSLPLDLFKRELATIGKEKEQLKDSLDKIKQRMIDQQQAIKQLDTLTTYCERVAQNLESFGFEEKRLALEALDLKVIGNGQEWRIAGSIPLGEDAGVLTQTSKSLAPLSCRFTGGIRSAWRSWR